MTGPGQNQFAQLFHWKHTSWVIACFGGAGLTAALADKFASAYVFFGLAAFWTAGGWLTSDALGEKRPQKTSLYLPDGGIHLVDSGKAYRLWQAIPTVLITILFVVVCFWIRRLQTDKELASLEGWLYPANEEVQLSCPLEDSRSLALVAGTNTYVADDFPCRVISINCEDVLKLDRDAHGNIAITFTILDRDGRVVVDIDRGKFTVNHNNYFKIDRQGSRSTIAVIDQFKQEVLYLHAANGHILQMRALLYYRGRQVRIDDLHPFPPSLDHVCASYVRSGNVMLQIGACLVR